MDDCNEQGNRFQPSNEIGVIVLFAQEASQGDYEILSIDSAFPDARIAKGGQEYRAEFEFTAANFKAHQHDPLHCDLIICWRNDWPESVLPVLELKDPLWWQKEIVPASWAKRSAARKAMNPQPKRASQIETLESNVKKTRRDLYLLEQELAKRRRQAIRTLPPRLTYCEHCGKHLEEGTDERQRFCSPRCRTAAYRKRKGAQSVSVAEFPETPGRPEKAQNTPLGATESPAKPQKPTPQYHSIPRDGCDRSPWLWVDPRGENGSKTRTVFDRAEFLISAILRYQAKHEARGQRPNMLRVHPDDTERWAGTAEAVELGIRSDPLVYPKTLWVGFEQPKGKEVIE